MVPGSRRSSSATMCVDDWEKYLDLMVDSVFANSGRGCINCSGIWASRHTREIADALAQRLAKIEAAAARPSGGERRRIYRARRRRRGVAVHRRRFAGVRRDRRDREVPRRRARGEAGKGGVPAADGRARRFARCRDREEGIHVSVRDGGRVSAGEDARSDRTDAGVLGDHRPIPSCGAACSTRCTSTA